ncbi:MAG: hypothetical protein K0S70_4728 [Microbacterium sp.]|jgi:hypothetical protein|nr:hypothetical protein [Microbacterium sp.]
MTAPAESMERNGDVWSWYCGICSRELGVDLDAPTDDGMPPAGCPEHGDADLGWETWNVESEPTYPHRTGGASIEPEADR